MSPRLSVVARVNFAARAGMAVGVGAGAYLGAPAGYWLAGALLAFAMVLHGVATWKQLEQDGEAAP